VSIFLHIGHGKTGSSAIQGFLASNANLLHELGFPYPDSGERERASRGWITSGNGCLVMDSSQPLVDNAIYSSELLHRRIRDLPNSSEVLTQISPKSILLITRDLHEHSWSAYNQQIKREGITQDYLGYLERAYGTHLDYLVWWIEVCKELKIDLKLWNYSRRKSTIVRDFLTEFLFIEDLSPFNFKYDIERVNRSLTLGELEIQRIFNSYQDSPGSEFLSDRWVNLLPELQAAPAPWSSEISDVLHSRFQSRIEEINLLIPEGEKILMRNPKLRELEAQDPKDIMIFTRNQIEIIIDGIQLLLESRNSPK